MRLLNNRKAQVGKLFLCDSGNDGRFKGFIDRTSKSISEFYDIT